MHTFLLPTYYYNELIVLEGSTNKYKFVQSFLNQFVMF